MQQNFHLRLLVWLAFLIYFGLATNPIISLPVNSQTQETEFDRISDIAVDLYGHVYVASYGKNDTSLVQKFDGNGSLVAQWGNYQSTQWPFTKIMAIDVDSSGDVYIGGYGENDTSLVQKFDGNGNLLPFKSTLSGSPLHMSVDSLGSVYITHVYGIVEKIDVAGKSIKINDPNSGKWFSGGPMSIDSSNDLYLEVNKCISKFDNSKMILNQLFCLD